MNAVLEKNTIETTEKEKHNAMIGERYRKLLDAVEDQFSASAVEENNVYAPTYVAEKTAYAATPVEEQAPQVTEYTPSALAGSLFTTETLDRMQSLEQKTAEAEIVAPVQPQAVVKAQTVAAVQYSLTPLAKVAMAVFTLIVVAMLVLIGVNSQIIRQKSIRINNLEEKKQELMEKNEEIQRYIQELQTDASVLERAEQAGLVG